MVNMIKCFAKATAVKRRQLVVQHIQKAVGCRSTFKAAELLGVNMVFNVVYQPLDKEIF